MRLLVPPISDAAGRVRATPRYQATGCETLWHNRATIMSTVGLLGRIECVCRAASCAQDEPYLSHRWLTIIGAAGASHFSRRDGIRLNIAASGSAEAAAIEIDATTTGRLSGSNYRALNRTLFDDAMIETAELMRDCSNEEDRDSQGSRRQRDSRRVDATLQGHRAITLLGAAQDPRGTDPGKQGR